MSFVNPSIAASIAALLAAVGVEVSNPFWEHVIEVLAMIFAVIGIGMSFWRGASGGTSGGSSDD